MGRRIEVELTSTRDDGSWTWRAAGAKQPKGELSGDLLYGGAKVGDVVKVEADFHLDGIEVIEVFPPKAKKERTDLLELKTRPIRDDELVTTQRVARRDRGDRGRRGDRPGRGNRGDRDGRGDRGDRGDRRGGSGRREQRPDRPQRPKPKRLRPKREHRDALLASIPEEHRPIVEQVVRDGMPGVRAAIDKQNTEAKEAGKPEIEAAPVLAIAERNLAAARLAEWRDRADAALASIDDLDLRDLRSVVVVGDDVARDEESRALADQLKKALDERMETDHGQWLSDLRNAVADGRVVRALRLSSRPVKAGAPLPTELAGELSRQAATALADDVEQSRWAIVLDALAFSPVRGAVTPAGIPAEPGEDLLNEVRRLSDRIPTIAGLFGIDPAQVPRRAKKRRPTRSGGSGQNRKPKQDRSDDGAKKADKPTSTDKPKSADKPETAAKPKTDDPKDDRPKTDTQPQGERSKKAEEAKVEQSEPEPKSEPVEADSAEEPKPEPVEADSAEEPKPEPVEADSAEEPKSEPVEAEVAEEPELVEEPKSEPTEADGTEMAEDAVEPEPEVPPVAEASEAPEAAEPEAAPVVVDGESSATGAPTADASNSAAAVRSGDAAETDSEDSGAADDSEEE